METKQLFELFINKYDRKGEDISLFSAPGRVNLIGEHTDYNGGHVFPCALSFGTKLLVAKRTDNVLRFSSTNMSLELTKTLDDLTYNADDDWANYPKGVFDELKRLDCKFTGLDLLYSGEIPNGSGLSSSASIEVVTAVMLNTLFDLNIDRLDLVKLCQRVENNYMGVNSGIMDQFAVAMGKKDNAMFLNCNELTYEYVPFQLENAKLIISNTNKRRGLADSKYNERRAQCEQALEILKQAVDITCLGDLTVEQFDTHCGLIEDAVIRNRAKHAVYENSRTKEAVKCLNKKQIAEFGQMMNESHISLRDLYEVTGTELDTLVEEAWAVKGTIGSRMTGAGFGGCTVSIVENDFVDEFIATVGQNYFARTGLRAAFYIADVGDGARQEDFRL